MKPVRVRIAPSPTGYPHIGTIWQALLNYAFARRFKGRFIVRIEDTDRKRLVPDAEKKLFASLKWFGLEPDESVVHGGDFGPYRQSERLGIYQRYADELVQKNRAYYCTCTAERLAKVRLKQQQTKQPPMYDGHCRNLKLKKEDLSKGSYVVRLKVPKNQKIIVDDLLRGRVVFDSNTIDDQVLIKSDGFPTYHLAVVIDDHLMKITHMVRAEEWLPSAPKNYLLYEYLGWEKPVFVHTPTLRNPDRSKMSKRHGDISAESYQKQFLPEAILNYLCLLGWSHPREKEIFSLSEFSKLFDLKDLSVSGPVFDINKLAYINGVYIRQKSDSELTKILKDKAKHLSIPDSWWPKIVPLIKERIKNFSTETIDYWLSFFIREPKLTPDVVLRLRQTPGVREQLDASYNTLKNCQWNFDSMQKNLLDLVDNTAGWKRSSFFLYLRLAVTGSKISLPLIESMEILGQKECLARIDKVLQSIV